MLLKLKPAITKHISTSISEQQSYNEAQNYREAASRTAQSGATVSIDNAKAIREYADQNGLAYSQVYNNPSIVAAAAMNAAVAQASNLRQQAEDAVLTVQDRLVPMIAPLIMWLLLIVVISLG